MRKRILPVVVFFLLVPMVLSLSACRNTTSVSQESSSGNIDASETAGLAEATAYFEEYLTTKMEEGDSKAVEYVYFNNDWEAGVFAESIDVLLSYEILSSEKLTDSLYVFHVEYDTAAGRERGRISAAYNFVAVIDGEYRVVVNIKNLPEDLQEGIDVSKDSNDTSDTIPATDVRGVDSEK